MNQEHTVYDLGEVDLDSPRDPHSISIPRREATRPPLLPELPELPELGAKMKKDRRHRFDWRGSLSLLIPGSGAWLRGVPSVGIFHLCSLAFIAVLAWSLIHSMHRIVPTLELLGQRRELGFWTLGGLFCAAAAVYLSSAWRAVKIDDRSARPHPIVAGSASFVIPGWGQLLNGDRFRSVCFISGIWVVLGAWILSLPITVELLRGYGMVLPPALKMLSGPAVRYTLPAVIWTLAVYDAVNRARSPRN